MFLLYADKTRVTVRQREPITSGSVNVNPVRFEFSLDWEGLERTAVFKAGAETRSVPLDGAGECFVPWEALQTPGLHLMAGVRGTCGEDVVLPTVWADLGLILDGASPGEESQPPTPELWEQELAGKGDALGFDEEGNLGLYAGDKLLSSVAVSGGGPAWTAGHGLKLENGIVSVDAVDDFTGDNTLPMTAAGVQTVVGSIETLLEAI